MTTRLVPCGRRLPDVGSPRENQNKETTQASRPQVNGVGAPTWGLADRSGDDRLMDKISALAIDAPAVCPSCGEADIARSLRVDHGVCVGDYRCRAGHIWETKWMAPA